MTRTAGEAFPAPEHNHNPCLALARERARQSFAAQRLKLTELRMRVFEEIAGSHHAVGAYDVLERLADKGCRLAPISVYRAIDALLGAGVIHRLESRNAFFACHAAHAAGRGQLVLACERCGRVGEVPAAAAFEAIEAASREASFVPAHIVAEVAGRCRDCREAPAG
jgi:Fur family zinc uptake transcriptional regulator